jgi:hypothetical protein
MWISKTPPVLTVYVALFFMKNPAYWCFTLKSYSRRLWISLGIIHNGKRNKNAVIHKVILKKYVLQIYTGGLKKPPIYGGRGFLGM